MAFKIIVFKSFTIVLLMTSIYSCSQINVNDVIGKANDILGGSTAEKPALTNSDIIQGLKEALTVGVKNVTGTISQLDGFNNNTRIKLPFPPEVDNVKEKLISLGMQNQVDKFVLTLNRAAEESSKKAFQIFRKAVTDMTITDGINILKGEDNAATAYLKSKTETALKTAFHPIVAEAINKVEVTKYWNPLISTYNKIPFVDKKDPDLEKYIIDRALIGIFTLVEDEEARIRKDPIARVSEILKKVFSSLD
ncbi:MAG: DUF4197 domain-containing protein [Bacteroidetes bacterium]|nr:DUF4197 domain-containing protein [Bacteroidota bacterium]